MCHYAYDSFYFIRVLLTQSRRIIKKKKFARFLKLNLILKLKGSQNPKTPPLPPPAILENKNYNRNPPSKFKLKDRNPSPLPPTSNPFFIK